MLKLGRYPPALPQKQIQSSRLNYIGTGEEMANVAADRRVPVTIPETLARHISSPVPFYVVNVTLGE